MHKVADFKIKGMNRDLSAANFTAEFAYENLNMRIMSVNDNTMFSLVNEKGNKLEDSVKGIPIGYSVINDKAVVFTTGDSRDVEIKGDEEDVDDVLYEEDDDLSIDADYNDRIYKVWYDKDALQKQLLFTGDLNFDYKHPIETLPYYENEDIQKVYWVDGKNQPRVINVANKEIISSTSIDFVSKLALQETFFVEKHHNNGVFPAGTIQYAFTYYNKNLQETNIVYTTPLYYTSYSTRGGSPEDKTNSSFYIYTANSPILDMYSRLDESYEYLRIYSILRTSIDSTPSVKRISDIKVSDISFEDGLALLVIDDGMIGETADPTDLLYKGGEEIIVGTFSQKNNTLFLGDLELKRETLSDDILEFFKTDYVKNSIEFKNKTNYYLDRQEQLGYNSNRLKTFKYLEWYRFGIQFQHTSGRWSNPVWVNDLYNQVKIEGSFFDDKVNLVGAELNLSGSDFERILENLVASGYIKARPLVVYPNIQDRESVCQGILCPTVYNAQYRLQNKPFVQSSWFIRPNAPYACNTVDEDLLGWNDKKEYTRRGIMSNDPYYYRDVITKDNLVDVVRNGTWAEFRHNHPIPDNNKRNAEIQCLYGVPSSPMLENPETEDYETWMRQNSPCYFIDQSIATLHSPDIEFDTDIQNLNTEDLKLRIVGIVPLTSTKTGISIQNESATLPVWNAIKFAPGYHYETVGVPNTIREVSWGLDPISFFGWKGLVSGIFWYDFTVGLGTVDSDKSGSEYLGYVIYPWHRSSSLNNSPSWHDDGENFKKSSLLKHKVMSNYRYSNNSQYIDIDKVWLAENSDDNYHVGISEVKVISSSEDVIYSLREPKNSNLGTIYYKGNIDQIATVMGSYNLDYFNPEQHQPASKKEYGYPIMITYKYGSKSLDYIDYVIRNRILDWYNKVSLFTDMFTQPFISLGQFALYTDASSTENSWRTTKYFYDSDPVSIKYKSTQHAVIAFNYTKDHKQLVLPTFLTDGVPTNSVNGGLGDNTRWFWLKNNKNPYNAGVYQDYIDLGIKGTSEGNLGYGFLWLAELYRDKVENRFGGNTEEALLANQWLPCGESVNLIDIKNGGVVKNITLKYDEGDTYYLRYDHLKTYPYTNEDYNSIVDAASFMCETRVNLLGRCDNYQDDFDFTNMTPELKVKFNQVNDVYSQKDNFFSYRMQNENTTSLDKFRNTITWTKTKTAGEDVDQWTNITLASTLDLDGNKGYIRAIRKLNDTLLAFQDKSISHILYNEQTQISTENGLPIEIANSGKVQGYRTIQDSIGCINKWSICSTPSGLIFTDDINKDIYLYGQQLTNLTDANGFHSWMGLNATTELWNPVDFENMVTYYDTNTDDVYFITKESALAYNVPMGNFTSFYSYGNSPYMISLPHKTLSLYKGEGGCNIWLQQAGDYNSYYGEFKPFYTTVVVNPDGSADKIYDNVFFTADSWDSNGVLLNTTFDTLTAWNEYQEGEFKLRDIKDKPANLKKKFRMWRAHIPRDKTHKRDRMRNPWLYLKLAMNDENYNKTILNSLSVQYFI